MYKALYGTRSGEVCWHDNPFDILQQMNLLKPLLFWKGDTGELTAKTEGNDRIFIKKWVLLMAQEWIHNPSVTPSSYPIKFWGLFGEVSHITHMTQQNFVIGQFAKMNIVHW